MPKMGNHCYQDNETGDSPFAVEFVSLTSSGDEGLGLELREESM